MKKLFSIIVLLLVCVMAFTQTSPKELPKSKPNVTVTDKGYVAIASTKAKADSTTALTYTDAKGVVYPVYRSNRGSDYVIKTSKKTGNKYRYYMKSK